jgi:hypothetical protein
VGLERYLYRGVRLRRELAFSSAPTANSPVLDKWMFFFRSGAGGVQAPEKQLSCAPSVAPAAFGSRPRPRSCTPLSYSRLTGDPRVIVLMRFHDRGVSHVAAREEE